jgi:hypothetical protein
MKKQMRFIVVLACLIVIGSMVFAGAASAKSDRPFEGTIQEAIETHEVIFPYFYVNGNGSGTATHLGLFTYSYQAKVRLPERVGEGASAHFIAANGDSLYAEGYGMGVPSGIPDVNLVTEHFSITGGTGRFDGATGSIVVERLVNTVTLESSGEFSGVITLP